MPITIVESDKGRRRVRPSGIAALLAVCCLSFLAIPTLFFWFANGVLPPVNGPYSVFCFAMGCAAFGSILGRALWLSPGKLPRATAGVDD